MSHQPRDERAEGDETHKTIPWHRKNNATALPGGIQNNRQRVHADMKISEYQQVDRGDLKKKIYKGRKNQ
ncbi:MULTISPECIES: hypothetical protein [unclassified Achromobacter]|uniref:hypothetical protein n=1 Tax=unclassified Achromobacter TaxID=2626865 RepID=UPI000B0A097B|nr:MULTISPECIES: hypothetical protein [unclassified Achromobacter]